MADEEEEEAYEVASIVLDSGSSTLKAGFSTESYPRAVFHSFVGRVKKKLLEEAGDEAKAGGGGEAEAEEEDDDDEDEEEDDEEKSKEALVFGDDASADRDSLLLKYPIADGHIRDWDDLEAMWRYTFFEHLGVDPEEYNVFVTSQAAATNKEHEKVTEMVFEKFGVPGLYMHPSSVLTLYSVGHTTGVVVDAGGCGTRVMPVYEGYAISSAVKEMSYGGHNLTKHFIRLLTERGYYMDTSAKEDLARDIKESMCFVAADFEKECAKPEEEVEEKTYTLPDGTAYTLGTERFRLPEAMFDPDLMGHETEGVGKAVRSCIAACDIDLRKPFFKRIVVGGGSSRFPGFCDRLRAEVEKQDTHGCTVKVQHAEDPALAVWKGGAILCGLSTFDNMWVSAEEYQEHGPSIILRKCAFM